MKEEGRRKKEEGICVHLLSSAFARRKREK
jgi:hypothetical protein